MKILVVDDDPTDLKLASEVLGFDGHSILKVVRAKTVLQLIRETPPDLILMGIALPGMDGRTLTRLLKADPVTRHIPILAPTAFAMKGDD